MLTEVTVSEGQKEFAEAYDTAASWRSVHLLVVTLRLGYGDRRFMDRLRRLLGTQDSFREVFSRTDDGGLMAHLVDDIERCLEANLSKVQNERMTEAVEEAWRSFQLYEVAPPWRCVYASRDQSVECVFLVHHIMADAVSMSLLNEFFTMTEEPPIPLRQAHEVFSCDIAASELSDSFWERCCEGAIANPEPPRPTDTVVVDGSAITPTGGRLPVLVSLYVRVLESVLPSEGGSYPVEVTLPNRRTHAESWTMGALAFTGRLCVSVDRSSEIDVSSFGRGILAGMQVGPPSKGAVERMRGEPWCWLAGEKMNGGAVGNSRSLFVPAREWAYPGVLFRLVQGRCIEALYEIPRGPAWTRLVNQVAGGRIPLEER